MTMNKIRDWLYVAPQRIRRGVLSQPKLETWEEVEALNMQRFARVLEMQGCVAFIGSGTSSSRNYPGWSDLLPTEKWEPKETHEGVPLDPEQRNALKENLRLPSYQSIISLSKKKTIDDLQLSSAFSEAFVAEASVSESASKVLKSLLKLGPDIGMSQLMQMAEHRLSCDEVSGRVALINFLQEQFANAESQDGPNMPLYELLKYPIHRYITTNYDQEIERELKQILGGTFHTSDKSFGQDDSEKLAQFVISLAKINQHMVFHCHGRLCDELDRLKRIRRAPSPAHADHFRHSPMVLTDEDYNYWYLGQGKRPATFQTCMQVLSQSTPLFFVGYSLSDFDVVRELRSVALRRDTDRLASDSFVLLSEQSGDTGEVKIARQIKNGINLLSYKLDPTGLNGHLLDKELRLRRDSADECRSRWRLQPKARILGTRPAGLMQACTTLDPNQTGMKMESDLLLDDVQRSDDDWLSKAYWAVYPNEPKKVHQVGVFIGPAGSAKLLKLSKLAHTSPSYEKWMIFHAYNNDDIYSYIKRVEAGVCRELNIPANSEKPIEHLFEILQNHQFQPGAQGKATVFFVAISNLDLFLDMGGYHPDTTYAAQDFEQASTSTTFQPGVQESNLRSKEQAWSPRNEFSKKLLKEILGFANKEGSSGRLVITMRTPPPDWAKEGLNSVLIYDLCPIDRLQLKLEPDEYQQLHWLLGGQEGGLILAAAYIEKQEALHRNEKLRGIVSELRSHPYDRGARVVRYIVRDLGQKHERIYEHVLTFLSCFNAPVTTEIAAETITCCKKFLRVKEGPTRDLSATEILRTLVSYRLVECFQGPHAAGQAALRFVVTPLAKRFCRLMFEKTQHPEMRAHGVHGLLSRGPFNSPGKSPKARAVFDHFADIAFKLIKNRMLNGQNSDSLQEYIRAVLDILRSNFACNSVPLWGKYRDYIEMLSFAIDLVRNEALSRSDAKGQCDTWMPGETGTQPDGDPKDWESIEGIVSAEEMIYLYNELGLSYYHTGAVQDALSVWGLAVDWQRILKEQNLEQATMYAASLYAHITMAYVQMGRMESAHHFRRLASAAARETGNMDLNSRMLGMEGRLYYFSGNIPEAKAIFKNVIETMRQVENRRGESYFMRLWSALELSYGDVQKAEDLARESLALASSASAPDLGAFSSELLARILNKKDKTQEAIREYRIALREASRMDISRLRADVLLGLARIQLKLGDPRAAHLRAMEALILSNEHLLVVRQIKSLILLGQSIATLGNEPLGISLLKHAQSLASASRFRTAEYEAQEAISQLNVSSGVQPT